MSRFRFEKKLIVKEIEESLKVANSFFVANYEGLTVEWLEELRNRLRSENAKVKVYKNRLMKLATNKLGFEKITDSLHGSNVFIFSFSEENTVAKILHKFATQNNRFELKAGIWEKEIIRADEIVEVAKLPTFEEAISSLAFYLMFPLQQLGFSLKLVSERENISSE